MTEDVEDIPQANEILYTVKLISGEELLCTVIDLQDEYMVIESPIAIKVIPILTEDGNFINKFQYHSWLPFAAERVFHLPFGTILTYSSMSSESHVFYTKLVNRLESGSDSSEQVSDTFFIPSVDTIQ